VTMVSEILFSIVILSVVNPQFFEKALTKWYQEHVPYCMVLVVYR
jgi:hypothetical protein